MVKTDGKKIFILNEGEYVQIEPYGKDVVRIRAASGEIVDQNWTLFPPENYQTELNKVNDETIMVNGNIMVKVTDDGKISYFNRRDEILLSEFWRNERDIGARIIKGMPGGLFHLEQHFRAIDGEHFFGLGQEAHDLFDLKGATLDLC